MTTQPARPCIVFDHRLVAAGLLLPATLALGLPAITLTCRAGAGQHRRQADDPEPWPAATASTTPMVAHRGLHPAARSPAFLRTSHPPAGPGEPGAAGPGLGRWGRTRRRVPIDRFHHLRDLRTRARHHGYTSGATTHCWPSPPCTGDVLMSRLREGRASLTLRADSGFYTHGVVSVCRKMDVRFSITIRQHKSLRNLIEAIPEDALLKFVPVSGAASSCPRRLITWGASAHRHPIAEC